MHILERIYFDNGHYLLLENSKEKRDITSLEVFPNTYHDSKDGGKCSRNWRIEANATWEPSKYSRPYGILGPHLRCRQKGGKWVAINQDVSLWLII